MGDRANIVVYETPREGGSDKEAVFLYTHWRGSELPLILAAGLARGRGRWGDAQYLARILFCEMVRGQELGETGYGISTRLCDNGHPLLVVDTARRVVVEYPESTYEVMGFGALPDREGVPFEEYITAHAEAHA